MKTRKGIHWKSILIILVGFALFSCAYILLTLFAIPVTPVEYKEPPTFTRHAEPVSAPVEMKSEEHEPPPALPLPADTTDDAIEAFAKSLLLEGQTPDQFAALFRHPHADVREAAARALAQFSYAHRILDQPLAQDEWTRRLDFMEAFWNSADKPAVLNALTEVISKSFETGEDNLQDTLPVLSLISEVPGLRTERAEYLAWVANHHPSEHARANAMLDLLYQDNDYDRKIGDKVLDSRASDPSTMVRIVALKHRMDRITFGFFDP